MRIQLVAWGLSFSSHGVKWNVTMLRPESARLKNISLLEHFYLRSPSVHGRFSGWVPNITKTDARVVFELAWGGAKVTARRTSRFRASIFGLLWWFNGTNCRLVIEKSWVRFLLSTFFLFFPVSPFYPLSSCQAFLASHFCTDWLSWRGLGNQVGSITYQRTKSLW